MRRVANSGAVSRPLGRFIRSLADSDDGAGPLLARDIKSRVEPKRPGIRGLGRFVTRRRPRPSQFHTPRLRRPTSLKREDVQMLTGPVLRSRQSGLARRPSWIGGCGHPRIGDAYARSSHERRLPFAPVRKRYPAFRGGDGRALRKPAPAPQANAEGPVQEACSWICSRSSPTISPASAASTAV